MPYKYFTLSLFMFILKLQLLKLKHSQVWLWKQLGKVVIKIPAYLLTKSCIHIFSFNFLQNFWRGCSPYRQVACDCCPSWWPSVTSRWTFPTHPAKVPIQRCPNSSHIHSSMTLVRTHPLGVASWLLLGRFEHVGGFRTPEPWRWWVAVATMWRDALLAGPWSHRPHPPVVRKKKKRRRRSPLVGLLEGLGGWLAPCSDCTSWVQ